MTRALDYLASGICVVGGLAIFLGMWMAGLLALRWLLEAVLWLV